MNKHVGYDSFLRVIWVKFFPKQCKIAVHHLLGLLSVGDILKKNLFFQDSYLSELIRLDPLINQGATHIYVPIKSNEHIVGMKELTPDGVETTVPNMGCESLLMISAKERKKAKSEVVIVHSVTDMLALASYKLSVDVVSLPHGKSVSCCWHEIVSRVTL